MCSLCAPPLPETWQRDVHIFTGLRALRHVLVQVAVFPPPLLSQLRATPTPRSWRVKGGCVQALTVAARAADMVKRAATETLGEFRQSQAAMAALPLKERLPAAVWDAIQDVASTSTYFV